ncbi:134_t:CDS:1, partial [Acaulospora colombiana]
YLSLMEAFLQTVPVFISDDTLYDHRYFYIHNGSGFYTCRVAAQTMTKLLQNHDLDEFNDDQLPEGKESRTIKTRKADKEVEPSHLTRYVNISEVDPLLAHYLPDNVSKQNLNLDSTQI